MSDYIISLIEEGEHQQQDFKFEISDSKKIARSLVAFANTDGGRLLVGVKDNGAVAGVRSDEEIHMIEAAAQLYCKPEVLYQTKEWNVNGKLVLEVIVPRSKTHKHKAPDKNNEYKIFVRVGDKNLLANSILLKVWKRRNNHREVRIAFTEVEMQLLRYLSEHGQIDMASFREMCHLKKPRAEAILTDFILLGVIDMHMSEKETFFELVDSDFYDKIDQETGLFSINTR